MPKYEETPRARIFISCGQSKDSDEAHIARAVAAKLRELDFEPWIAVDQQMLEGVKKHIFETLANSEYVIFVDSSARSCPETGFFLSFVAAETVQIPAICFITGSSCGGTLA